MSEILQRSKKDVKELAASSGLVAFTPRIRELLLDMDDNSDPLSNENMDVLGQNGIYAEDTLRTTSRNGRTHVYLLLNQDLNPGTRIALQILLGSDSQREALSLVRVLRVDCEAPTALFETKHEAHRVNEWRREYTKARKK